MVDFLKMAFGVSSLTDYTENSLLSFAVQVATQTGEVLSQTETAQYNGFVITTTPSQKQGVGHHFTIKGSIATFLNNGVKTAENITLAGLTQVIERLESSLKIPVNDTFIQNMEISVNVALAFSPSKFINMVKGHFEALPNYPNDGSVFFETPSKEYTIKLYDKGKELKRPELNILRVEVRYKKARYLEPYGIKTVSDLTDKSKVEPLVKELIKRLEDVIIIDNTDFEKMPISDREKLNKWINPLYWTQELKGSKGGKDLKKQNAIRAQKKREKKAFLQKISSYGLDSNKRFLLDTIPLIWGQCLVEKKPFLNIGNAQQNIPCSSFKSHDFTVRIKCENVTQAIFEDAENTTKKVLSKQVQKRCVIEVGRVCEICSKNINQKRPQAVVCSKRCSNIKTKKTRAIKKQKEREKEDKILSLIFAENVTLRKATITINIGGVAVEKIYSYARIKTMTKKGVRSIVAVAFHYRRKAYLLTKNRAKEFVKYWRGGGSPK